MINLNHLHGKGGDLKVRIRCNHCGFEIESEVQVSPLGSLKPDDQSKGAKIKIDKDTLDKILEVAQGASREELQKIGLDIDPAEWESAQERRALRKFLKENIKVSKEKRKQKGEKYVVATEPWRMGDSFKDVDLPSSEVKSFGIEDLRLIPGVTLQKKVYGITKGREQELLKGIKFLVILDGSGSMISQRNLSIGKIAKALLIGKEIYEFCKKLGFDYHLVLFSDHAVRVPDKKLRAFWKDPQERASYPIWNGGTKLSEALKEFSDSEYKDANVVIISDMDIADLQETKDKITKIAQLTNSFKIILIEQEINLSPSRVQSARELFPPEYVKIMTIPV